MKNIKRLARRCQEWLERGPLGTRLQEWAWRGRHLYRHDWARGYLETIGHPHRSQIVDAVAALEPESVLEIGCASGANLVRLRQRLPQARLIGLDINREAIRVGRRHFGRDPHVQFILGQADRLTQATPQDVVLCDAILMFIAPDRIQLVMHEIARMARKGIVLNEYHTLGQTHGLFDGGRWVYDLTTLLREVVPAHARIDVCKSAFTGGLWDQYGSLITVRW